MASIKTLSINEISERINVSPRTIRKVLRANANANDTKESLPGRGGRYVIRESDVEKLAEMIKTYSAKTSTIVEL